MPNTQLGVLDADGRYAIPSRWQPLFRDHAIVVALPHNRVGLYTPDEFVAVSEQHRPTGSGPHALSRFREWFASAVFINLESPDRIEFPWDHQKRLGGPGSRVRAWRASDHLVLSGDHEPRVVPHPVGRSPWLLAMPLVPLLLLPVALGLSSLMGKGPRAVTRGASSPVGYADTCRPRPGEHCAPIHYTLNPAGSADPTFVSDAREAVNRISQASGVGFVYDGLSSEAPVVNRAAYQPRRYGKRWAPLLIAWTNDPFTLPADGTVPMTAHPICQPDGGRSMYLSGQVALRSGAMLPGNFTSRTAWGAVIMRGVVRALGIPYSSNPADITYLSLEPQQPVVWGPGDLAALRRLVANDRCVS